jgi:hypothetical protein
MVDLSARGEVMASGGPRWFLATALTIVLATLFAVHAYIETSNPATATDAFSSGIAGVIQDNETLRAQYEQLQGAAGQAPDRSFEIPGLGISMTGSQIQQTSFDEVAGLAGDQIAEALYYDGSGAARDLLAASETSGNPEVRRTSDDIASKLDSFELGLGIVTDETNDFAEVVRTVLIIAALALGGALFVVSSGPARLTAPGIVTLTAAVPYVIVFFFASQWFEPQDNVGLTENVRESLAPTVDGLFSTYIFVTLAGAVLLALGGIWALFLRTGHFGLEPPQRRRPSGEAYQEPAYRQPTYPRPRAQPRPAQPASEPYFELEQQPAYKPPARKRPAPWSSAPPAPGCDPPPEPPAASSSAGPFGELLSQQDDRPS